MISFKRWLEDVSKADNPVADQEAKRSIQDIGKAVSKAIQTGEDPNVVVADKSAKAAEDIANKAANQGGNLAGIGKITQGLKSIKNADPNNNNEPLKKMRKK